MPEHIRMDEAVRKFSRTGAAMAEALEDGIDAAKRVGKHGCDATEELVDDTQLRIKRHPVESVVGAFVLGFIAGGAASFLMRRRCS